MTHLFHTTTRRVITMTLATIVLALSFTVTAPPAHAGGWYHDGYGNWFLDANSDGIYEDIRVDINFDGTYEVRYLFDSSGALTWMNFNHGGSAYQEVWADFRWSGFMLWYDSNEDGFFETLYYDAGRDLDFEWYLLDSNGNYSDDSWQVLTATSSTSGGAATGIVNTGGAWSQLGWYAEMEQRYGTGPALHEGIQAEITSLALINW